MSDNQIINDYLRQLEKVSFRLVRGSDGQIRFDEEYLEEYQQELFSLHFDVLEIIKTHFIGGDHELIFRLKSELERIRDKINREPSDIGIDVILDLSDNDKGYIEEKTVSFIYDIRCKYIGEAYGELLKVIRNESIADELFKKELVQRIYDECNGTLWDSLPFNNLYSILNYPAQWAGAPVKVKKIGRTCVLLNTLKCYGVPTERKEIWERDMKIVFGIKIRLNQKSLDCTGREDMSFARFLRSLGLGYDKID